jgi:hypothetical protein
MTTRAMAEMLHLREGEVRSALRAGLRALREALRPRPLGRLLLVDPTPKPCPARPHRS